MDEPIYTINDWGIPVQKQTHELVPVCNEDGKLECYARIELDERVRFVGTKKDSDDPT